MIQDIIKNIGIPETACQVYLYLLENGLSSARQIAENINIPRTSVYGNLEILKNNNLIIEQDQDSKKLFRVDDVGNISRLLKDQINNLQKQEKELKEIMPDMQRQSDYSEPKIKFYNGAEGIKHVLNDSLWYDNIEILCVWPIQEMIKVLGADYLAEYNKKRIRQKIGMKVIWPKDKTVPLKQFPFLGIGSKFYKEIKIAPKGTWDMGYWIYADKVAFISSRKESFSFVVHSRDFVKVIKSQFELIWPLCKKIEANPKDLESFLKTI